jgi:hypothetical protein
MHRTEIGTPQGSILSPILANIFLHYVLDEWFEYTVKKYTRGFCELVRYADDFIIVTNQKSDAEKIEQVLYKRFKRYGLELHPEKTKRISFGAYERINAKTQHRKANTFDFLGFTHYCGKTRKGKFKVGRKTSKKKFAKACKEMNNWLRETRNRSKTKHWWKILVSKLRGHYQYYGVSENSKGITNYYHHTTRMIHKWLNRRSQKRKMNWKQFKDYLTHYPIPKPKIKVSFYTNNPMLYVR